jgi:microsomal dipeptidase-like Zn-dependent dipeptidase
MYPNLTKLMLSEGYTQDEVRKILGLNFLRVFKQVCG